METLLCETCKSPTFLCACDSSWLEFNDILKSRCYGASENGVVYTSINVSTMTICFEFNQFIDLQLLKNNLPESLKVSYKPGSKKSKIKKKKGTDSFYNSFDIKITIFDHLVSIFSNVSIFIFPNGKAKAAGVKTINTIHSLIEEMIEIVKYVPDTVENPERLGVENIKIDSRF
jgi:hypothetical protein